MSSVNGSSENNKEVEDEKDDEIKQKIHHENADSSMSPRLKALLNLLSDENVMDESDGSINANHPEK